MLNQIAERYDPENDLRPDGPPVTWAEYELYIVLLSLASRVEKLEKENDRLKQSTRDAMPLASGQTLE